MVTNKKKYIDDKCKLLQQFNIDVTDDIRSHIEELYPREISTENYIRKLILDKLR